MLDSRSPELKTKHLFPLTNISAFPCPPVPSNHHTTLCSCEFDFFFNNFIYFWLCWVFIAAHRLSLVAASRGYSADTVHGLLIVMASLAEHRLYDVRASVVVWDGVFLHP